MKFKTLLLLGFLSFRLQAQVYMAKESEISFFSASVIENIEARNTACKPVMNTATGDVLFKVPITSFVFSSSLMQEHFNENYMESEKFPFATFAGRLNEKIDYTKSGCYKITASGTLTMHGVPKQVTAEGTLTVNGSEITLSSVFDVRLADYEIEVPTLYVQNIAEVIQVRLHAVMQPYVKS